MTTLQRSLDVIQKAAQDYMEGQCQDFDPADPRIVLHEPTFGPEEIRAFVSCMLTTQVTAGETVRAFERAYASNVSTSAALMVNSGSSANLLAIATLTHPLTEDRLKPGDEVIVPALSWSTTVWPLVQCGLVPVIVDIDPATLNIDPNEIERAIGPRTRGVMIVPVYGNPCDMDAIVDICHRHDLVLVEDTCEAMGASYRGKPLGGFGRVGTFSLYFSHHITTLEGGFCVSSDTSFAEVMRIVRAHGWLRDVEDKSVWSSKHPQIDERFLFVGAGYNLRATEPQAAMGLVQLDKLNAFVEARRRTAAGYKHDLAFTNNRIRFQAETPNGHHSWFGFPMVVSANAGFSVDELISHLNGRNIETRPIICGNIARQPGMALYQHRVLGDLANATEVMDCGFSVGNHQAISNAARAHVVESISDFFNRPAS
jgi:CDP-4-dehydro-6-deoxyglucose reductase, E1